MAKRKKRRVPRGKLPQSNRYLELLSDELYKEVTGEHAISSLDKGQSETLRKEYDIRTTVICWGIPMDEILYTKFFTNYILLMRMPWDSFITTESTYLPDARNAIHKRFLETTDAPYLMMLDSDVLPPPNLVNVLLSHDKHIVGGWYKNKSYGEPHPVVYDFAEETEDRLGWLHRDEPGIGLEKVDGMGAGCWLMSRELAEALGEKPYSMEKATEDLVLCKKVMDLGYEMWVDWDMKCAHAGISWV